MVCNGISGGNGYVPPNDPDNKKKFPDFFKNWTGEVYNGGKASDGPNKGKEVYLFPVNDEKGGRVRYIGARDPQSGRVEYRDLESPNASVWIDYEGDGTIDEKQERGPDNLTPYQKCKEIFFSVINKFLN